MEGLGVVGCEQIVPQRVGSVEVGLGILDIRSKTVARVEGPVVLLVQSGHEKVPLLGLCNPAAVLGLEPVDNVLLAVGQQSQLDLIPVKVVALPRVEQLGARVADLALGGVTNSQTRGVLALGDDEGGTDPAALVDLDVLEAQHGAHFELGRGLDVGVLLPGGLDGEVLDVDLLLEEVGALLLMVGLGNLEVLGVMLVVLAGDEVRDPVDSILDEVADGVHGKVYLGGKGRGFGRWEGYERVSKGVKGMKKKKKEKKKREKSGSNKKIKNKMRAFCVCLRVGGGMD